jgi:hypothetical protein
MQTLDWLTIFSALGTLHKIIIKNILFFGVIWSDSLEENPDRRGSAAELHITVEASLHALILQTVLQSDQLQQPIYIKISILALTSQFID